MADKTHGVGDPKLFKYIAVFILAAQTCSAADTHIIFFTQEWCGPCQKAHKELEKNATYLSYNPESVDPDNLRTEDEKLFYEMSNVRIFPTFIIYRDLKIGDAHYLMEMGRIEAYSNRDDFLGKVKEVIDGKNRGYLFRPTKGR